MFRELPKITQHMQNLGGPCFQSPLPSCVSQGSPEKQGQQDVCLYVERGIYFKEFAHESMESSMSKICRVDQPAGLPGKG